jgi:hypothetical protein
VIRWACRWDFLSVLQLVILLGCQLGYQLGYQLVIQWGCLSVMW